jgi:pimeloyl-ACP methyl ester carboxylesterase
MKHLIFFLLLMVLTGCSATLRTDPDLLVIDQGRLAAPNLEVRIPGLGPCTDGADRSLHLNAQQPVLVLVHGCLGSAGRFRALAEVFAYSGQQAVCFSYNDRDSLMVSSAGLVASIDALAGRMQNKEITVIGHSQGGLIARKALTKERPGALQRSDVDLRLVTISAPFSGIHAASHCGSLIGRILSFGLTVPICQAVSGDKWFEITYASPFIRQPGPLLPQVGEYLKIDTDERDSCRTVDADGRCTEGDFVFSLGEQRLPQVDGRAARATVEVKAGHVEIVGDHRVVPVKLVEVLQQHGVLKTVQPGQAAAFGQFLARLYGAPAGAAGLNDPH